MKNIKKKKKLPIKKLKQIGVRMAILGIISIVAGFVWLIIRDKAAGEKTDINSILPLCGFIGFFLFYIVGAIFMTRASTGERKIKSVKEMRKRHAYDMAIKALAVDNIKTAIFIHDKCLINSPAKNFILGVILGKQTESKNLERAKRGISIIKDYRPF